MKRELLVVPPIYDAFCLYSLNHQPLFVLNMICFLIKFVVSKKKKLVVASVASHRSNIQLVA